MTALLLKFAPWIAGVLVVFGAGAWSGHKLAQPAYDRLQGQYSAFQLQTSKDTAARLKAAADALTAQIAQRNTVEDRNAVLESSLESVRAEAMAAHRDADFASRLLTAARQARPVTASDPSTKAGDQQPVQDPPAISGSGSAGNILGLTTDAIAECRGAFEYAYGLAAEVMPQL